MRDGRKARVGGEEREGLAVEAEEGILVGYGGV